MRPLCVYGVVAHHSYACGVQRCSAHLNCCVYGATELWVFTVVTFRATYGGDLHLGTGCCALV